ncbi:MAG: hypothetical protein KAI24_06290, partial [Planctomycetes bacterium]|nr:hypothetical protein [Planctomycetota bacterium]
MSCALVPAQHDDPTLLDFVAPQGGLVPKPADGGERWFACRVVDAITGEGIPAAEVLLLAESATPIAGELPVQMRAEADYDGFVSIRVDAGAENYRPWGWLCVRAAGYGQSMRMGMFDDPIVRLMPGVSVPVQVRDWRDQPVADVLVGFCSGCGHTPDLVHGRTGADGVVTLPGVDIHNGIADFYLVHPDLDLGYLSPTWYPGRRPMVLRAGVGVVHRGVVVDDRGRPVAGAAVGMSTVHRGPWTRTQPDGSFTLCGLDGLADLWVHTDGRRLLFEANGTTGLHLRVPPPPAGGDQEPGKEPTVQVFDLEPEQRARLEQQREHEDAIAEARERAWPRVPVRVVGGTESVSVELRTATQSWDLDDAIASGEPVALPDGEFVFRMTAGESLRIVPGDRAAAVADGVVRLRWFAPTRIEGR